MGEELGEETLQGSRFWCVPVPRSPREVGTVAQRLQRSKEKAEQ